MSKIEIMAKSNLMHVIVDFETLAWISQRGSHIYINIRSGYKVALFSFEFYFISKQFCACHFY